MSDPRPFAIVTGASTGIGFELAKRCAKEGYDLLIAADEPAIEQAVAALREGGTRVEALQVDLATNEGVDGLYAAVKGRQVDVLLANAGRGLGHGFLDQDFEKGAAGCRHQHHWHDRPDLRSRERHAAPEFRENPHYRIDRRLHAW